MLLFLDFDGVLHPYPCTPDRLFCRLGLLQDWLRLRPQVDVVISSTWRQAHPLEELRGIFDEDLRGRVLGVTPEYMKIDWSQFEGEPPPPRHARHAEVLSWLRSSSAPWRAWCALDDAPWLFRPFTKELILCDRLQGVSVQQIEALDRHLSAS